MPITPTPDSEAKAEPANATGDILSMANWCVQGHRIGTDFGNEVKERLVKDICHVIASVVAEERSCNGWQPIETAPKDGTVIFLALHEWNDPKNEFCVVIGKWLDGEWMPCGDTDVDELHPPKLWMPFPKPPVVGAAIRKGAE